MRGLGLTLASGALLLRSCLALDAAGWKRQSIYQVLTDRFARDDDILAPCNLGERDYCGGNWRGMINKLDYIQDMGFTAVWISPVVQNLQKGYHGYFGLDQNKLNDHFGTVQDLKDLSAALHARGMYLMIDVVTNHVASAHHWQDFQPNNDYGAYNLSEHFHPFCWIEDYENQTQLEDCWLGPFQEFVLADLDTRHPDVIEGMNTWVKWLVKEFDVDGLRLDTVKHVNKDFWPGFVEAAGVFCIGEVYHGNPDYVAGYQWDVVESLFNFPTYYKIIDAFQSTHGDMFELTNSILTMQAKAKDVSLLVAFTDNHDVMRFGSYTKDHSLRMNAFAASFVGDGFPVTYSGSEYIFEGREDPYNREPLWLAGYSSDAPLYGMFKKLNMARQLAMAAEPGFTENVATPLAATEHEIVLRRSPLISVLSNRGAESGLSIIYVHVEGLKAGTYLTDLLAEEGSEQIMVGHNGNVRIEIHRGEPRVLIPSELLKTATAKVQRVSMKQQLVTAMKAGMAHLHLPGNKVKSPPGSPVKALSPKRSSHARSASKGFSNVLDVNWASLFEGSAKGQAAPFWGSEVFVSL